MFTLQTLPFDKNDLEPFISSNTIEFHYEKHHRGYLNKLNELIQKNSKYSDLSLENIIYLSKQDEDIAIFNNAAQVWNHTFYWNSLKKNTKISKNILKLIEKKFASVLNMCQNIIDTGMAQFGSGWVWLVFNKSKNELEILKTSNADCAILYSNLIPLCVIDVWEHAYYLDYQNRRLDYMKDLVENLINFDFISENLKNIL